MFFVSSKSNQTSFILHLSIKTFHCLFLFITIESIKSKNKSQVDATTMAENRLKVERLTTRGQSELFFLRSPESLQLSRMNVCQQPVRQLWASCQGCWQTHMHTHTHADSSAVMERPPATILIQCQCEVRGVSLLSDGQLGRCRAASWIKTDETKKAGSCFHFVAP